MMKRPTLNSLEASIHSLISDEPLQGTLFTLGVHKNHLERLRKCIFLASSSREQVWGTVLKRAFVKHPGDGDSGDRELQFEERDTKKSPKNGKARYLCAKS